MKTQHMEHLTNNVKSYMHENIMELEKSWIIMEKLGFCKIIWRNHQ